MPRVLIISDPGICVKLVQVFRPNGVPAYKWQEVADEMDRRNTDIGVARYTPFAGLSVVL